jgi:hypothetical protein
MIVTTEAIPVEAEIVEPDYASSTHLAAKYFLLLLSGSVVYMAAFYGLVILGVLGGVFVAGTTASIRLRGQTLVQASALAGAAVFEVLSDLGTGGTQILEHKVRPVLARSAKEIQRSAGLLSEAEQEAISASAGGEVVVEQHVLELVIGSVRNPMNTLYIARKQSGKTTFTHGLLHNLLSSQSKNIVLVGDPNYGTGNDDGPPPAWAGLPVYDRRRDKAESIVAHHRLFAANEDIYAAMCALNDLYHRRMQINADRVAQGQPPEKFAPVYYFVDEFQTFLGSLSPDGLSRVNGFLGDLIRAAKYKIFFYPICHNDKATDGLDTTNLAGVNLFMLGSVLDSIRTDNTIRNSRSRFSNDFLDRLEAKRRDYDIRYGPKASAKMLGVVHLVDAFTSSDGTEFAAGAHIVRIPDYRAALQVRHDFSALPQPENLPVEATPPSTDSGEVLAQEFVHFLRRRRAEFDDRDYSVTEFFTTFKATAKHDGWGRRREKSDPHYCLLRDLAQSEASGKINPVELLRRTEGL